MAFIQLVAPDDDGLEGQRAFAQAGDHRLAAGLDALGDGDLALARQQLDRAHVAQVHAHGIVGALGRLGARLRDRRHGRGGRDRTARPASSSSAPSSAVRGGGRLLGVLALDHGDAHVGQHRHGVLDLLGGHFLGGQHGIELVEGDEAARLGGLDELLDRRIGQIEQRAVLLGGFDLLCALFVGSCCVRHHVAPGRAGVAAWASGRGAGPRIGLPRNVWGG